MSGERHDPRAGSHDWLEALRREERRLQQDHAAAEAHRRAHERAEAERLVEMRRLEERVHELGAHISGIEASRAWRVATLLQSVAARVPSVRRRPAPPPPAPASPAPPQEATPPDLPAVVEAPGQDGGRPSPPPARAPAAVDLVTGEPGGGPPSAEGEAPYLALLDPGAEVGPEDLAAAVACMEEEGWDALIAAERGEAGVWEPRAPWSPVQAASWAVASGLVVLRRDMVARAGGLREEAGWDAAHDLLLRAPAGTRVTCRADVECRRRGPAGPLLARRHTAAVLRDAMERRGVDGWLESAPGVPGAYRVRRRRGARPRVSVVIPTRDRPDLLEMVLGGLARTRWQPLEVVIVDNGSTDARALSLLDRSPHRVVSAPMPFNFPHLVNRGAEAAAGDVIVLMNNDVEVADPGWLEALVDEAMDDDAGPVGALLEYPHGPIQHCGIALRADGVPVHPLLGLSWEEAPASLVAVPQERIAVSAACMAVRAEVWRDLEGMEPLLAQNYNDVDLCLRAREAGLAVVYTPFARLVHHESSTRGTVWTPDVAADWLMFRTRWAALLDAPDPWWPADVDPATGSRSAMPPGRP